VIKNLEQYRSGRWPALYAPEASAFTWAPLPAAFDASKCISKRVNPRSGEL
jgi:hypothetical protein